MSLRKPCGSKRKYDDDIAIQEFKSEWEEQYFLTMENSSKPVCLICGVCIAILKIFNLETRSSPKIWKHSSY